MKARDLREEARLRAEVVGLRAEVERLNADRCTLTSADGCQYVEAIAAERDEAQAEVARLEAEVARLRSELGEARAEVETPRRKPPETCDNCRHWTPKHPMRAWGRCGKNPLETHWLVRCVWWEAKP